MKKKVLFAASTASAALAAYTHQADAAEYKVKSGDSLWSIANKHGISIDQLKSMNKLTTNLIFPNQTLKVSGSASSVPVKNTTVKKKPASNTATTTTTGIHTVQAGESLSIIANKYGTSYTKIMELNNLDGYLIFPGQTLKVSGSVTTTTTSSDENKTETSTTTTKPASGSTYTVQAGDYLSKIAAEYGVTVDNLKSWNGLTSNIIYVNQKLIVSGDAATSTTNTQTTPPVKPAQTTTTTSPVFNHQNLYDYGQCTWYVFNKRAAIGKGISTYWWHAHSWANGARNDGYTVDNTPEVGAIAQTSDGAFGHVAFVERVNADGTILVSETNYLTPSGVVGYRTLTLSQMQRYVFIH